MVKRRQKAAGIPNEGKSKKQKKEDFSDDDEDFLDANDGFDVSSGEENEQVADVVQPEESVHEKKVRLAKAYLDKVKEQVAAEDEENADETEREGKRDSRVADLLRQEQLEETGRVQRDLAARVIRPEVVDEGRYVVRKHRQSVTAVALADDELCGFSASKDGLILQWDVETGKSYKYNWPSEDKMKEMNKNKSAVTKRPPSKHVFSVAVDSSGRYLATGGPDRFVHLWDVRTREHIQAFPGHRGAVSSLVFRQGTTQLISGSYDRTIKLWSADDRCYLDTLFGHQGEVLAVDCLRQERLISTGRDRTVRIFKVPEETQLVFRGHAPSLESCCFLTNAEFMSGSDDGSVALWHTMKKKPIFVAKNAHRPVEDAIAPVANGNGVQKSRPASSYTTESWVGAVASCRGSDLAASGAGDGKIQLWALTEAKRKLAPLHSLPVTGFVNGLAFGRSGSLLVAAVGQEHRLGRWSRNKQAKNGVLIHKIDMSS